MAERKAVNKYYPPDWDPRKGSVNKRVGQHPLRDRAKKLSQGILVIRFELPYNIWCGGCGSHVGMGVRYNAEKSKVGNYYTTPIYKFRMKCHLCDNYFEIQTDPKNHDYVILSGARRKEQRWDPVANEQIVPEDKATQKKMAMDAMYKLEHGTDDQVRGKEKVKNLAELESSKFSMKDDYLLNRMARDKFRSEKKLLKEAAEADRCIIDRGALDIELLEETEEDRNLAGLLKYSVTSTFEEKQKEKRKSIEKRSLFESTKSSSTPSSSSSSSTTKLHDSQNGQSKQKLSTTLRLSQKDPFSIAEPVKLFDAKSSKSSNLGIRLLGSRVIKRKAMQHTITKTKKAVMAHIHSQKPDGPTQPSEDTVLNSISLTNCSVVPNKINQPIDKSHENPSHNFPECSVLIETSDKQNCSPGYDLSPEHKTLQTTGEDSNCGNLDVKGESTSVDMESYKVCEHPKTEAHNYSGLSALMRSYEEDKDSDSDSNSSS